MQTADTTRDDFGFDDLDAFMMQAGKPATPEVEDDQVQHKLAEEVRSAPFRAEYLGLGDLVRAA